jgi:hypothetical protein
MGDSSERHSRKTPRSMAQRRRRRRANTLVLVRLRSFAYKYPPRFIFCMPVLAKVSSDHEKTYAIYEQILRRHSEVDKLRK